MISIMIFKLIMSEGSETTQSMITSIIPISPASKFIKTINSNASGGSYNINVMNDHELANRIKFKHYMDYFGLDDYDSYYAIELDPATIEAIGKYTDKYHESKHVSMNIKLNNLGEYMPMYQNRHSYSIVNNDDDKKKDDNFTIEYMNNDICYEIDYNGNKIIYIDMIFSGTSKSVIMSKDSLEILKEFATKIRTTYNKEQKEKRVIRKQIMVYTNYRQGNMDGSAKMMSMNMNMDDIYTSFNPRLGLSDWKPTEAIRARSFDSIFLNSKTKNMLLTDIDEFMSDETCEWYDFHDIPSKRSYLFYGPPGTGKTSTVKAIAGKYNMELYIMKLNLREIDDMAATNLMQQLTPKSILFIEDIDANFNQQGDKADVHQAMTFSGLLNILDGVTSFRQQIIIMTTNKRDHVNRESLRTGRIDMEIEFGYMDNEQVTEMLKSFYNDVEISEIRHFAQTVVKYGSVTPAELQEVIIRSKNRNFSYIVDNIETLMGSVRAGRQGAKNSLYN